ncbi:MAG: hypothetical protein AB1938_28705 [Myxococcota bacterium]
MSLEHELRAAGEKVAEGRFRIDGKRALERLKDHRFADPSHWVLEVLRAAALSGAKKVVVRTDADDVEVSFDGLSFAPEVMKDLLSQGLVAGVTPETRRARLLGLGVAGALGVSPKYVWVESGGLRVTLLPDGEVEVAPCAQRRGTHLALRKAFGWRVATAVFRGAPEVTVIRGRCGRFGATLELNGASVPPPPWCAKPGSHLLRRSLDGVEVTAAVADAESSDVTLDVLGVVVTTRVLTLPGLQLHAWVRGDDFRTNASGSDVVDSDKALQAALRALAELSLEALAQQVARLRVQPDEAVRDDLLARLLSSDTSPEARAILEEALLIPGPSGERCSVAELKAEVAAGRSLYVAHSVYPEGSYPRPTVLHPTAWAKVLPPARWVNVAELVQRNRRAAENRKAWLAEPLETAALHPDEDVFGRVKVDTPQVEGEVGLHRRRWGAFIRLLCAGRFLQQGDVPSLAPLRLHAVVNLKKELPTQAWADVPSKKLFSLVTRAVAEAAEDSILQLLKAGTPSPDALAHARDLLVRLSREKKRELPEALLTAPLFHPVGGGDRLSLRQLDKLKPLHFVRQRLTWPLLSGEPVLELTEDEHALLKALGKPLHDVTLRLLAERDIRRRLAEEHESPRLEGCHLVLPLAADGMTGEVGIGVSTGQQRVIALYRDGFRLDRALVPSALPQLWAAVDCPDLKPDERWEKAVRDAAFQRVVAAVRASEPAVAAALVERFPRWADLPPTCRDFLARWMLGALGPGGATTPEGRAVEKAPLFDTSAGARSLAQLRDEADRVGHLWVLPHAVTGAPPELVVVVADAQAAEVLAHGVGRPAQDARPELERRSARELFARRPRYTGLPVGAEPRATGVADGVRLEAGLFGQARSCGVDVLVDSRQLLVEMLPTRLPLAAYAHVEGVEPGTAFLSPEVRGRIGEALRAAEHALMEAALERADELPYRRVLLSALAVRAEASAPEALAARLQAWRGFPLTDGGWASAADLEQRSAVCFVEEEVHGAMPDRTPVVRAADADVRAALARFKVVRDVTDTLRAEVEARARRAKLAPRAEVKVDVAAAFRRAVKTPALEGEVVVAGRLAGRLELYTEKKPLCVVQHALPVPLAAAINCDALTPQPGHAGVVQDAAYDEVLSAVAAAGDALAFEVAARWPALDAEARSHAQADAVALLFWVAGRKKGHALTHCPLLESTTGQPLSLAELTGLDAPQGRKKARKKPQVPYAGRAGALLDEAKKVWRPREGELALAQALGLPLKDVTPQLEHAETVRARKKQDTLRVDSSATWRAPVAGRTVQGEVVLPEAPTRRLEVHLLHEMTSLERYSADHPVGALAEINCDALRPNADWTKAVRNQALRDALAEVDAAVEACLARRLSGGPGSAGWRPWALAALGWKREVGPLADVLRGLPLFERLDGKPATLGEVLAEHSRKRRVAVATKGKAPAGALVLASTLDNLEALRAAGLEREDVTADLERAEELEVSRRARRLSSLVWPGQALLRLDIQGAGLKGQVAIPLDEKESGLDLAREGVRVGPAPVSGLPAVAGVLDVEELPVNEAWTEARPTPAQETALRQAVDAAYGELAKKAAGLPEAHRAAARQLALEFLRGHGVTSAGHLDRLTGVAASLARAPLFHTIDGREVTLRMVADEVLTRGKVAVLQRRLLKPDVGDALVLEAELLHEPWLEALGRVLGSAQVERVVDFDAWKLRQAEADPPKDTPEWGGLERLRREVRLLRAGALGRLTPHELEDVRLSRAGGKRPLRYDKKRKLVVLDPDDEAVHRALVEYRARPERLFALAAAVYAAVNRALDHLTDEHEADLLLALAGHLAANPKLLEPRGPVDGE